MHVRQFGVLDVAVFDEEFEPELCFMGFLKQAIQL